MSCDVLERFAVSCLVGMIYYLSLLFHGKDCGQICRKMSPRSGLRTMQLTVKNDKSLDVDVYG